MRKERNPAKPAATRLCGIYYGIKQKEKLSGAAADKPGLGIITDMCSSTGRLNYNKNTIFGFLRKFSFHNFDHQQFLQ